MYGFSLLGTLTFHVKSVWLFTFSDLKTIVLPSTAFAMLNRLATLSLSSRKQADIHQAVVQLLFRVPLVAFWAWINLLPFAIDNQRQPEAIKEDTSNKPWRTMPSGRLQQGNAKMLMCLFYMLAILASVQLGAVPQCLILILLGCWYNDLHGADKSCIVRNFINASGFVCYTSGALQVATPGKIEAIQDLTFWFLIVALVVFSTVQAQDMYDQPGDSLRKRKTVPLVLGDLPARWTIALPTVFWSCACPRYWSVSYVGYSGPLLLGHLVAVRTVTKRSVSSDKKTFCLWNLWLISLYSMPLIHALENLSWDIVDNAADSLSKVSSSLLGMHLHPGVLNSL